MKKLLFILFILLCLLVFTYKNEITDYILLNFIYRNDFNYINDNEYKLNDFHFKTTDNYLPQNKDDILNIIYTSLNNGYNEFNFYCKNEYKNCSDDIETLINNQSLISNINNFVHPFNSYEKINVSFNGLGKINVKIDKQYSEEMINVLNKKVNDVYNDLITEDMDTYKKIKTIHDYILENTKYDTVKASDLEDNTHNSSYMSDLAYGPLIEGYGICSGYTDAMSLFLNKMKVPNYKISSQNHVWNYVYINGSWLHLDLTWDDPVTNTGIEQVNHNYFLITTDELLAKETTEHNFDKSFLQKEAPSN